MATKDTSKKNPAKQPKKGGAPEVGSTQTYLNIAEIKDGVVVLKDGSLRAVLMTSSLNFALKSAQEQDAIILAYQSFLNSLTFPVQILVQSRRLDLEYYLAKLTKLSDEQANELIKLQIVEYSDFIKRLITVTNIMDKRFFVVVPFYPAGTEPVKGLAKVLSLGSGSKPNPEKTEEQFQKNRVQLTQRVEAIASGLGSIGLRAVTLSSEELVELYYASYNPQTATKQRLLNVDQLTASAIKKERESEESIDLTRPVRPGYTKVGDEKTPEEVSPSLKAEEEQ